MSNPAFSSLITSQFDDEADASTKPSFVSHFVLGGTAAAICKTALAPFIRSELLIAEPVRTPENALSNRHMRTYRVLRDMIANQGVFSLWRGNAVNVLRHMPHQAFNFAFKEKFKARLNFNKQQGYWTCFGVNMVSGGLAGASSLCFLYPLNNAQFRLSNDIASSAKSGSVRQFDGLIDVVKKTVASDGVTGLYRGFGISCAGVIAYRGCYFGLYDSLKPIFSLNVQDNIAGSFLLSWAVVIAAVFAIYPVESVRRRMMMTGNVVRYRTSLHCAREILNSEGSSSFFKGANIYVLKHGYYTNVVGAGAFDIFTSWFYPNDLDADR
eukprot:TRINITY_DN12558_c9_g1_i1.p1 TRINITY_DN12558_c9_g1~~TRINITY_DN12558_c9_g1_i1.p1  ORF type:complete len:325 (+),score=32.85 TRINITY_DN12558_c9_g1_i1:147-1121(+)